MRKATFTNTTATFTEQFTVIDAQIVKHWEDLTEYQMNQFKELAIKWENGSLPDSELLEIVRSILYPEKSERVNMKKDIIFISGDDYGCNVSCYNCGKKFIDSLMDKTDAQQESDINTGSVVCTCGQRIAYIEKGE